jgi:hypothetical protein
MSNLKAQVSGLHDDLKVAVQRDPKTLAGIQTHTLLMDLANQALSEVQDKKPVETVLTALRTGGRGGFSVTAAHNLAGQLLKALE